VLSYNKIPSVPYDYLDILINLRSLDLDNNLLVSFPDPAGPSNTLTTIQLRNNQFSDLPSLPILGSKVTGLAIAGNPLGSVSRDVLLLYPNLELIDLDDTLLTGAVPDLSIWSGTLETAQLRNNQLTTINPRMIHALSGSEVAINLDGNLFSGMPSFYHENRTGLDRVTITLSSNPFICDCRSKWLRITQMDGAPVMGSPTCASPGTLAGQLISDLTLQNLRCSGMIECEM
jgi:Leucine-rich repeat (LRR) protein